MSGYSRLSGSTRIRSDQLACFLSVKTPEWRIWEGHRRAIPALDKLMDSAPKLNPGRAEPRRILSRRSIWGLPYWGGWQGFFGINAIRHSLSASCIVRHRCKLVIECWRCGCPRSRWTSCQHLGHHLWPTNADLPQSECLWRRGMRISRVEQHGCECNIVSLIVNVVFQFKTEEWQVYKSSAGAAGEVKHSACSLLPSAGSMRINESV